MVWILIAMSTGYYNAGTISSVEFYSQEKCVEARLEMQKQKWDDRVQFICVKK